jgi:hypothetical protein
MNRTGVIIAMDAGAPRDAVSQVRAQLEAKFPGVAFAIVGGAVSSVAFTWNDDTTPPPPPPPPPNDGERIGGNR